MSDDKASSVFLDDLVQHFRELAERLQTIDSAIPPKGMAPALIERCRDIERLAATASFFKKTNVSGDSANGLGNLAGYLSNLDNGKYHPVITAAPRNSVGIDRKDFWEVRSLGSLGLVCMIKAGHREGKAARLAARDYPKLDRVKRYPKANLAGSILSWHSALTAGNVKDNEVQGAFTRDHEFLLQELNARPVEHCEMLAKSLLTRAEQRAEALIIPEEGSAGMKLN